MRGLSADGELAEQREEAKEDDGQLHDDGRKTVSCKCDSALKIASSSDGDSMSMGQRWVNIDILNLVVNAEFPDLEPASVMMLMLINREQSKGLFKPGQEAKS